jgi:hypothetical protein
MTKIAAKYPLFAGRTVRESRRAEAEYYKDMPEFDDEHGSRPVCPKMSQRRIKKAWAKYEAGKPLGRMESRLVGYYQSLECMAIDDAMLRNAY